MKKIPVDSPEAPRITEKMINFIALDHQPLSVVDNSGLRNLIEHLEPRYVILGRKYVSDIESPALYQRVAASSTS